MEAWKISFRLPVAARAAPMRTSVRTRLSARAPALVRLASITAPSASRSRGAPKQNADPRFWHLSKTLLPLAGLLVLAGYGAHVLLLHYQQPPPPPSHWMSPHRFSPFRLVHKETVLSSNLIFLTLVPEEAYLSRDRLGREPTLYRGRPTISHRVHLCSVETMHPLAQISREYTPLETGYLPGGLPALRLAVRVYPDGEMSRYLDSVPVGGQIRLRGPHQGFDVAARMGGDANDREIVFVAGGTGILPVLRVLGGMCSTDAEEEGGCCSRRPKKATVLWALRAKSDFCLSTPLSKHIRDDDSWVQNAPAGAEMCDPNTQAAGHVAGLSPIGNRLAALKQQLGPALKVGIFLDDERGRCAITARDMEQAMGLGGGGSPSGARAANAANAAKALPRLPPPTPALCALHNPSLTPTLGKDDTAMLRDDEGRLARSTITCKCSSSSSSPGHGDSEIRQGGKTAPPPPGVGRNVLVVSGPDGFVASVAGRTVHINNMRSQGSVTGMAGAVTRRNPGAEKDWIVLKLDG